MRMLVHYPLSEQLNQTFEVRLRLSKRLQLGTRTSTGIPPGKHSDQKYIFLNSPANKYRNALEIKS